MKEVKFSIKQTDCDRDITDFLVTVKDSGTAPNIKIYQSGEYYGELTLSESAAKELVKALNYLALEG